MKVLHLYPKVEAIIGAGRPAPAHVHIGILRVGTSEALRYAGDCVCDPGTGAVGVALDNRIAEINLAGTNLIRVGKIVKMVSLCADVCDLEQSSACELVLNGKTPKLSLGDFDVL